MRIEEYRCLVCSGAGTLEIRRDGARPHIACTQCRADYGLSNLNIPILMAPGNEVFDPKAYLEAAPARGRPLRAFIPQPSINLSQERALRRLGSLLAAQGAAKVLVVGAGRQREYVLKLLNAGGLREVALVCTDIDVGADVDCFCDAHELPFADASFDGVITTAVLEHVLDPNTVAAEITRVVRLGGFVYSEVPFMQQVHEGAYDFTRYTLGGHRRLLNRFRELEAGAVAGPGTALVWALESFAASWFRSRRLAKVARLCTRLPFFWLKYCDYVIAQRPAGLDGASCTYLLGERVENPVTDSAIIARYQGARSVVHTRST